MNNANFFETARADDRLGITRLTQAQVDCAERIIAAGQAENLPLPALAYVLATAWHEAKLTPGRENLNYTAAARIRQVWPARFKTIAAAQPYVRNPRALANKVYNGRLGNRTGTDDGYDYRGGGLDQLTGRANYETLGIVDRPVAILDPAMAVRSLMHGMTTGRYRGHTLAQYCTKDPVDFVGARAIINADANRKEGDGGTVGQRVAAYAEAFVAALQAAGYTGTKPATAPEDPGPTSGQTPVAASKIAIAAVVVVVIFVIAIIVTMSGG